MVVFYGSIDRQKKGCFSQLPDQSYLKKWGSCVPHNVSEQQKNLPSPDLKALKLWKGRSGCSRGYPRRSSTYVGMKPERGLAEILVKSSTISNYSRNYGKLEKVSSRFNDGKCSSTSQPFRVPAWVDANFGRKTCRNKIPPLAKVRYVPRLNISQFSSLKIRRLANFMEFRNGFWGSKVVKCLVVFLTKHFTISERSMKEFMYYIVDKYR